MCASLVAFTGAFLAVEAGASTQPNIVFILADDLDATTSEYWERATNAGKDDPLKKTRQLLRNEGMTFTNGFAPTPICCPARSTILTGKLGHNTGVLTNGGDQGGWGAFVANGNESRTVAVWLKGAGYRTGLIGKYLNGIAQANTYVPPGWSEWYGFVDPGLFEYTGYNYDVNENGSLVHQGRAPENYSTDYVARKAVDFIQRAEANDAQPFFLYVSPTAPHLPLPPAPRHANHPYKDANPPRPPNYLELNITDKPAWLRLSGEQRALEAATWNPIDYRDRQGSLYALDDLVESIYNTLKANGELENTYIVFVSDNGYNLGAHRLVHKMAPYEESIRVPLVIRGPGIPAGSIRTQMTLESDFAPTFATWAGIAVPPDVDGRALQPLLGSTAPSGWRTDMLLQYVLGGAANGVGQEIPPVFQNATGVEIPTYSAVRNERYTFIEWYDDPRFQSVHEYELYDRQNDPYQLNNLLSTLRGQLQNASLVNTLKARKDALMTCKAEACR